MLDIKYCNNDEIFNIHTDDVPYLSFKMLDDLGVPNLYSTRFLSYDDETGTGEPGLRVALMKTILIQLMKRMVIMREMRLVMEIQIMK